MKNNDDLLNLFTKNYLDIEQAANIVKQCNRVAREKSNGNIGAINTYIDEIYGIVENFYLGTTNSFYKKNEMIVQIIEQINKMYEENTNILTQNRESINSFIKSIIENYNGINSEEDYNYVLNSIIAFIGCENKQRIYTLNNKDKKIINTLFENKINNLETLNRIIESIAIIADTAPEEIAQIISKMLQEGIQEGIVTSIDLADVLDNLCEIIDNQPEQDLLKEFYNTVSEDFKMHKNNKCEVEEFFEHIIANSKDILEVMQEMGKNEKKVANKKEQKPQEQQQDKFDIVKLISDLPEKIKKLPKGAKKRIAPVALALIAATGVHSVTHHTVSVQETAGMEQETETGEQEENEYFQDDTEYSENGETKATENVSTAEIPEYLDTLPVRIDTTTNTDWGAHGPKEGTEVAVMTDSYGKIYKIIFIEDGKKQEITNPYKIQPDYLSTDITGFTEDYRAGIIGFDIEQSIEPSVYKLNRDFQYTSNNEQSESLEEDEISDEVDSEIQEESQETEETEEVAETITIPKGAILGYMVVENNQIVIRTTNGENRQDIPISYFENISQDFGWQIEGEIYADYLKFTPTEDILVWDETHTNAIGVIKAGQEMQIDFTPDGKNCTAKFQGITIGYLSEGEIRTKIEEFDELMSQDDNIIGQVDKHYPISSVKDEYYNGVRVPKEIDNKNLASLFMQSTNVEKMPDTKFNETQGTIIEIDTSKNINDLLQRIAIVLRITGKPFGLEYKLESEDDYKTFLSYVKKIQNSEYANYFQDGVLLEATIEGEQYYYGWDPTTYSYNNIETDEYKAEIDSIKQAAKDLKSMNVAASLLKTNSDKIDYTKFSPEEISFILTSKRGDDGNYSEEMMAYFKELTQAGYKVAGWEDPESHKIALADELVYQAIVNIALSGKVDPEITFDEYEEYEEYDESIDDSQSGESYEDIVGEDEAEEYELY